MKSFILFILIIASCLLRADCNPWIRDFTSEDTSDFIKSVGLERDEIWAITGTIADDAVYNTISAHRSAAVYTHPRDTAPNVCKIKKHDFSYSEPGKFAKKFAKKAGYRLNKWRSIEPPAYVGQYIYSAYVLPEDNSQTSRKKCSDIDVKDYFHVVMVPDSMLSRVIHNVKDLRKQAIAYEREFCESETKDRAVCSSDISEKDILINEVSITSPYINERIEYQIGIADRRGACVPNKYIVFADTNNGLKVLYTYEPIL